MTNDRSENIPFLRIPSQLVQLDMTNELWDSCFQKSSRTMEFMGQADTNANAFAHMTATAHHVL